jgi:hypothetical protein
MLHDDIGHKAIPTFVFVDVPLLLLLPLQPHCALYERALFIGTLFNLLTVNIC